jgi:NTE family protein
MAQTRENPPGYNFDETFWQSLKDDRRQPLEATTFKRGEIIAPRRREIAEIHFVRDGVVACEIAQEGQTARTLYLRRGSKFQPEQRRDGPVYRALTDVEVYRLARNRVNERIWADILKGAGQVGEIGPWLLEAARAFKAQPALSRFPSRMILDLMILERVVRVLNAESTPVDFHGEAGFYFVASGEAQLVGDASEPKTAFWDCRRLSAGSVHSGALHITVPPGGACTLVCLPALALERYIRSSPACRRALKRDMEICRPMFADPLERPLPQFILVCSAGIDVPLREFVRLLAETVAGDFDSRTLVLALTDDRQSMARPELLEDADAALYASTAGLDGLQLAQPGLREYDYVFLVLPAEGHNPAMFGRLQDAIDTMDDDRVRTGAPLTLVLLTGSPYADPPEGLRNLYDNRLLRVVLLGGALGDEDPAYMPRTVRLRMNIEEIRQLAPAVARRLPRWMRDALSRLARALTERVVGVALSGGGTWAFAHIALLQALHEEGIPIDLVSGASGGSIVGAYYCAMGVEGLAQLQRSAGRLDLAVLLSAACTSKALAWAIQLDLEGRRLRDLEIPLYPIVADLTNSVEFNPQRGGLSVAECVRASSTLVPLSGPTTFEGRRCVDGVYVNNTGERILKLQGADFVISSDVVQTPAGEPATAMGQLWRRLRDTRDGTHLLVQSSDSRDSFLADCIFHPRRLPSGLGISVSQTKVDVARPQAEQFVQQQVKPLWDQLRAP